MGSIMTTVKGFAAVLLAVALATGCASDKSSEGPSPYFVKFDDPVCGTITLEILDAFHIPHAKDEIPVNVWRQWACVREINKWGRVTLVILWEPKNYVLTFDAGADGRVSHTLLDPPTYQEVIGGMVIHGRVDSLTHEGIKTLMRDGRLRFTLNVRGYNP